MAYRPLIDHEVVALRSPTRLEKAMRRRDVNGRELARLAGINHETIARLRRGGAHSIRRSSAQAIERALRAPEGEIFNYTDVDNEASA